MANTIPCPNPVCPHDFSLTELQTATQLLCPKCGFRMAGKAVQAAKPAAPKVVMTIKPPAPKPTPPKPAVPIAPASTPPLAVPIVASPIVNNPSPVSSPPPSVDASVFSDVGTAGPLVRTVRLKKRFNWLRLLIVLFVFGFAASIVAIAGVLIHGFYFGPDGPGSPTKLEGDAYIGAIRSGKNENEKVYKLVLAKNEWSVDGDIARRFNAHAAWSSKDYHFWFALAVKDFGMVKPRDAEMLRLCLDKLEGHFGDALELDAKTEPTPFGSLPGQRIKFRGDYNNVKWLGECYLFFQNGIAYWLFIASPDQSVVDHFAGELPVKHVFPLSDRRGWREQPPALETFTSADDLFTMTAPKNIWEKSEARNVDENGKLLLAGRYQKDETKDNRKNAVLLVFTMEKKGDLKEALTEARDYIAKKKKAENENFKVVHTSDVAPGQSEIGTLENVGNRPGRMIDLKLQFQDEAKGYYLLAVINDPEICYAIQCECAWESRQIWRQDFLDVLRTLKVKKAE